MSLCFFEAYSGADENMALVEHLLTRCRVWSYVSVAILAPDWLPDLYLQHRSKKVHRCIQIQIDMLI